MSICSQTLAILIAMRCPLWREDGFCLSVPKCYFSSNHTCLQHFNILCINPMVWLVKQFFSFLFGIFSFSIPIHLNLSSAHLWSWTTGCGTMSKRFHTRPSLDRYTYYETSFNSSVSDINKIRATQSISLPSFNCNILLVIWWYNLLYVLSPNFCRTRYQWHCL
jgi:hypothetical protein